MKSLAVIGAQYGQEGKGQVVYHLASDKSCVVRFNGGSQSQHLVRHNNSEHHFRHIGSGYYKGASTWLTKEFVCNPECFLEEMHSLSSAEKIYIHPECRITTPYDVLLHQRSESENSSQRGINETIRRHEVSDKSVHLRFRDLKDKDYIRSVCKNIAEHWVPARIEGGVELGIEDFVEKCTEFYQQNEECSTPPADALIFEAGQGLMVDEVMGVFPDVTPSLTGLPYIADVLKGNIDVLYVARCYVYRPGSGDIKNELPGPPYGLPPGRYAYLDLDVLASYIIRDVQRSSLECKTHVVFTHCVPQVKYRIENVLYERPLIEFLHHAKEYLKYPVFYMDDSGLKDVSLLDILKF